MNALRLGYVFVFAPRFVPTSISISEFLTPPVRQKRVVHGDQDG